MAVIDPNRISIIDLTGIEEKDRAAAILERIEEPKRLDKVAQEIHEGRRRDDVCDKCGRAVSKDNDATLLDYFLGSIYALFAIPRHLLPVVENGTVVCEGSPSRAQYLPGQARDKRVSYPYRQEQEARLRKAYKDLQHAARASNAQWN